MVIKRLSVLLSCVLAVILLAACGNSNYSASYLTNTEIEPKSNDITLISSKSEIDDYLTEARFASASDEFLEKANGYEESFFENKMLIILNIRESSGSNEISIKSVDIQETAIEVTMKRKEKSISDGSLRDWSFFIEVDKTDSITSVSYSFK